MFVVALFIVTGITNKKTDRQNLIHFYNGIRLLSQKEETTDTGNHGWIWKSLCWAQEANTKEYISYNCISAKFKNRQNWSMGIERRIVLVGRKKSTGEYPGMMEMFYILHWMIVLQVHRCQNSKSNGLKMWAFYIAKQYCRHGRERKTEGKRENCIPGGLALAFIKWQKMKIALSPLRL